MAIRDILTNALNNIRGGGDEPLYPSPMRVRSNFNARFDQPQVSPGSQDEWSSMARRAISTGGRVVQSSSGDLHLVSPSGSHWGSFDPNRRSFAGGTLRQLPSDGNYEDVTSKFRG